MTFEFVDISVTSGQCIVCALTTAAQERHISTLPEAVALTFADDDNVLSSVNGTPLKIRT